MLHDLLPIAIEAVASAMSITRAVQHRVEDVAGHLKDDRSPVTVADYASQAIVSMMLREGIDDPSLQRIVGEEDGADLTQPEQAAVLDAVTIAVQSWRPGVSQSDVLHHLASHLKSVRRVAKTAKSDARLGPSSPCVTQSGTSAS